MTRFSVLGPLEVWHDGAPVPVPAGRARVLLATLLLRAGRSVPVDDLVARLWDGDVPNPHRVRATLHMVVTRLRQALGPANVVRTTTNGYRVDILPGDLDLHRFRDLSERGRYADALALWRGTPLSDVRSDLLHAEDVAPLLEERLLVLERRVEADLDAGRAGGLVAELRSLTRENPLRERFWGQLVLALYRSDQQAEALAAYQTVRELLADELGVDPSEYLRGVHQSVLNGDAVPPAWPVLCQLPPDNVDFVGRADLEAEATELLACDRGVPVVAITGAPGTGKSALTVRIAHETRARFPDGQLFVRLDGAGGSPRDPAEVLAELLAAVGVDSAKIPDRIDARAAAFRARIADRAVLVVLDDAAGLDQVRPLLPGTPGCAVLISSRNQLTGLQGVRGVRIRPLAFEPGLDLLSRMVGAQRIAEDRVAAAAIVEACGGLPLALRIVGARLAARRSLPLAKMASRLADERRRLDELSISDLEVRAGLALSYAALSQDAALAFRRLGLLGAADIAAWVVKTLAGLDDPDPALEQLVDANLIEEVGRDATGEPRYRLHDLLAVYAAELARADGDEVCDDALRAYADELLGLLDHVVKSTWLGTDELPLLPVPPPALLSQIEVDQLVGDPAEWYAREASLALRAVELCATRGWAPLAHHILDRLLVDDRAHLAVDSAIRICEVVVDAARRDGLDHVYWRAELHYLQETAKVAIDGSLLGRYIDCVRALHDLDRPAEEAIALASLVHFRRLHTGEPDVASAEAAVEAATRAGVDSVLMSTLREFASMLAASGRYAESLPHFARLVEVSARSGDPAGEALVQYRLGTYAMAEGDMDRAVEAAQRSVELMDRTDDVRGQAYVGSLLGRVLIAVGRAPEALDLLVSAHREFTAIGEVLGIANAVAGLAEVYLALDDPESALEVIEPFLRDHRDVGLVDVDERVAKAYQAATGALGR
ncbi:BTAD domain-containing putative transcriptional regulator [Saccharothrix violaceirubra]|uniref:DNA-binding SARP family transcriptional activator/tetratricopeptide (TPR) repeat protein n=1 Tax=Saccharothrix violaceirubra TaxID=413306 RepID=A0A7W7WTP0_9PSEU|nr:AfsR/SARP family transcriptional regulator [Saccharothrix violaceirubra]MBB4962927.1 DNA-binding SARP family transcriptional activator/tetratricopeptide (TPR) repeat protein [Saccharothrix violaceirubra]